MVDGEAAKKEIVELHAFFTAWYNGVPTRTESQFARLTTVLAADFQIITPEAGVTDREAVLEVVEQSWGRYQSSPPAPPFVIEIRNFVSRPAPAANLVLATYEEWQTAGTAGELQGRLSSVLLRVRADCPNGLEWLHLHECWLPGLTATVSIERGKL